MVERLTLDQQAQFREQEQLGEIFAGHGLLAASAAMRDVFRRAVKASHFSDLPVLILGETGTGKQRLAEAIHALDPRRGDKPFVTINCGALSKTLAESDLFGHVRGAFSGAAGERKGLFRAANGGTLMLDEVGELDLDLQPKLLRVLQERRLLPVGEDYEHPIDVRVIAATNRPLEAMVAQGRFREDLFQRLNVFRVQLPALRERPEDVELQAHHFLAQYQVGRAARVTGFGSRVMEALRSLPWEGNTRQLENVIRETLAHHDGASTTLELTDLPRWVFEKIAASPPPPAPPPNGLLARPPGGAGLRQRTAPGPGGRGIRTPAAGQGAGRNRRQPHPRRPPPRPHPTHHFLQGQEVPARLSYVVPARNIVGRRSLPYARVQGRLRLPIARTRNFLL